MLTHLNVGASTLASARRCAMRFAQPASARAAVRNGQAGASLLGGLRAQQRRLQQQQQVTSVCARGRRRHHVGRRRLQPTTMCEFSSGCCIKYRCRSLASERACFLAGRCPPDCRWRRKILWPLCSAQARKSESESESVGGAGTADSSTDHSGQRTHNRLLPPPLAFALL